MDSFFSSLPLPSPFPPLVWSVDSPVLPGFTASRISLAQPNLQIPYLIPFQHSLSSNPVRHPVPVSVFQRSSVPASQASTIQPIQPTKPGRQSASQPTSQPANQPVANRQSLESLEAAHSQSRVLSPPGKRAREKPSQSVPAESTALD